MDTRIAWGLMFVIEVACFVLLVILFAGCGSARVVVPEESAIVEARPDTTVRTAPAPLPRTRVQTLPEHVVEYRRPDTASAGVDVTAVVATRETITIRTRAGEQTFRQPATGETLVLQAHRSMSGADTNADGSSSGAFTAGVAGKQERVVLPTARPSLLEQLLQLSRYGVASLLLVLVVLIFLRIRG